MIELFWCFVRVAVVLITAVLVFVSAIVVECMPIFVLVAALKIAGVFIDSSGAI